MPIDPTTQRLGLESYLRSYLRYQVFQTPKADLHVEAGKIPTPFGSFSPRAYSDRSALISYPLMYHYFSSLRANQLLADNADLLRHRGEGLAALFRGFAGGGSSQAQSGLPMIYDSCWVEFAANRWESPNITGRPRSRDDASSGKIGEHHAEGPP